MAILRANILACAAFEEVNIGKCRGKYWAHPAFTFFSFIKLFLVTGIFIYIKWELYERKDFLLFVHFYKKKNRGWEIYLDLWFRVRWKENQSVKKITDIVLYFYLTFGRKSKKYIYFSMVETAGNFQFSLT